MLRKSVALARQQGIGLLALFVALGGTSYAVGAGSIDSREIKNNTIRSKDIRNNEVGSKDVRDRSLLAKDFKNGQLPAGPAGPAGARGDTGAPGTARAYATMRPDECFGVDAKCSIYNVKNVASIRRVGTGDYCVAPAAGLSFEGVTPGTTTDDYNSGPANGSGTPIVAYSSLRGSCLLGEIRVRTFRATGATPTVAASNSTSFGIVIP
jgi:hypothetical protein